MVLTTDPAGITTAPVPAASEIPNIEVLVLFNVADTTGELGTPLIYRVAVIWVPVGMGASVDSSGKAAVAVVLKVTSVSNSGNVIGNTTVVGVVLPHGAIATVVPGVKT